VLFFFIKRIRLKSWLFLALFTFLAGTVFVACDENGNEDFDPNEGSFESLESPYLICVNRNSGGVGFDFEYREKSPTADLMTECGKLAIGIKWKSVANNDVVDNEPVWIIKTRDGCLVKLIVSDFPADTALTSTTV